MIVVINSKLKNGSRGLYRITYDNGYIYCGSFVNRSGSHPAEIAVTYFGSSKVALCMGWRADSISKSTSEYNKSRIKLFEIWYLPKRLWQIQTRLETKLIRHACRHYGIADVALVVDGGKNKHFTEKYCKHGKVINLQAQDMQSAYSKAHQMLKEGKFSEKQKEHYKEAHKYATVARTKETFEKISKTKCAKGRKCKVISPSGEEFIGTPSELRRMLHLNVDGTFADAFKSGRKIYSPNRGRFKGYKFITLT